MNRELRFVPQMPESISPPTSPKEQQPTAETERRQALSLQRSVALLRDLHSELSDRAGMPVVDQSKTDALIVRTTKQLTARATERTAVHDLEQAQDEFVTAIDRLLASTSLSEEIQKQVSDATHASSADFYAKVIGLQEVLAEVRQSPKGGAKELQQDSDEERLAAK